MKIAVVGPTYPHRGGIAHYTSLLAASLSQQHEVRLYGFRTQYPKWLFPGHSQIDPSAVPLVDIEARRWLIPWWPISWRRLARDWREWRHQERLQTNRHTTSQVFRHIAYIGGLAPHKGLQVLIDAMNQLPETVRLTIYGDVTAQPDYVAQLKQRTRHPHIEFLGSLPHVELYSVLKHIDVVVVPLIWYETSALIVQEAQTARVPVLASDIGALRETTLNGGGQVFPPGDVNALRDGLQRLIDFPNELDRMRNALKQARTLQAHAADIEALYREIVSTGIMN